MLRVASYERYKERLAEAIDGEDNSTGLGDLGHPQVWAFQTLRSGLLQVTALPHPVWCTADPGFALKRTTSSKRRDGGTVHAGIPHRKASHWPRAAQRAFS